MPTRTPEKPPKRLYKFINSKYLADLMRFGRIRIGSTAEYREDDGQIGGRSDPFDTTSVFQPGESTIALPEQHFLRRQLGFRAGLDVTLRFGADTKITFMPSVLAFCCSYRISDGQVRRMRRLFDCDTYFIIDEPLAFAHAISAHYDMASRELLGGYITYQNYSVLERREGGEPDPFRKEAQFAWQREYRFVWKGKAPEGVLLDVPAIVPHIRLPGRR